MGYGQAYKKHIKEKDKEIDTKGLNVATELLHPQEAFPSKKLFSLSENLEYRTLVFSRKSQTRNLHLTSSYTMNMEMPRVPFSMMKVI